MTQLEFDFEPDKPTTATFEWGDPSTYYFTHTNTNHLSIGNLIPNYNMCFHRSGTEVGRLDFNGPELTFTGQIAPSARVFLDYLATVWKTRLEQEYNNGYTDGQNTTSL